MILMWFEVYPDDFFEPPDFGILYQLQSFAQQYLSDSDLAQRCAERIAAFMARHEQTADVHGKLVDLPARCFLCWLLEECSI